MLVLYSNDCPRCKILERKLQELNLPFKVSKDLSVISQRGYSTVPMLMLTNAKLLDFSESIKYLTGSIGGVNEI